jgi:hypothetical protein
MNDIFSQKENYYHKEALTLLFETISQDSHYHHMSFETPILSQDEEGVHVRPVDFFKALGKHTTTPGSDSSQEALFDSARELEPVKPEWYLEITQGRQEWSIFPIAFRKMTLCRYQKSSPSCPSSIALTDSTISSPQALLYYDEWNRLLTLLHCRKALNPTMINDRIVQEHRLREHDQISMGFVRMTAKQGSREALSLGIDEETVDKVRAASYTIQVLEGPDRGMIFSLGEPFHIIGRGMAVRRGGNERTSAAEQGEFIAFIDPAVSREQAFLRWEGERFVIWKSHRASVPMAVGKKMGKGTVWHENESGMHIVLEKSDFIRIGKTLCLINCSTEKKPVEKHPVSTEHYEKNMQDDRRVPGDLMNTDEGCYEPCESGTGYRELSAHDDRQEEFSAACPGWDEPHKTDIRREDPPETGTWSKDVTHMKDSQWVLRILEREARSQLNNSKKHRAP